MVVALALGALVTQGCGSCDSTQLELFGQEADDAGPGVRLVDGPFIYVPPGATTLRTDKALYEDTEHVTVFFDNMAGTGEDSIVIAHAGAGADDVLKEIPTMSRVSGDVRFSDLRPGTYVARAFFGAGEVQAESEAFTVVQSDCPAGQARCAGICVDVMTSQQNCGACGVVCGDGDACNGEESCKEGVCLAGTSMECDDDNPCTADSCGLLGCEHTPLEDGTACMLASACTVNAVCTEGACHGDAPTNCDDGNPCTTDTCDLTGGCMHTPLPEGTACSDGNACNGAEVCMAGACEAGPAMACDDGNACTADSCDPARGCATTPVPDGTLCDDGNAANGADACLAGVCTPPTCGASCDDGNPCTVDACGAMGCTHTPAADGTACGAGDACSGGAVCQAGACQAGTALNCDDGNPCTTDACGASGCTHTAVADGTACGDGNACNGDEVCRAGTCAAGTGASCDDGNPCTTDHCDPTTGCTHSLAPDGTACPDGIACNGDETCHEGACRPGVAAACEDDGNPCTADVCGANGCEHRPQADGFPCSDGQVCNGNETCQAGVCQASAPATCDDGNQCTSQRCDPGANRCVYDPLPDGTACDDGLAETTGETCRAGICGEGRGTRRISETVDGKDPNEKSEKPFLSLSGNFIAFQSTSSNLIPGDTNGQTDVFITPATGGQAKLVSAAADGSIGNNISRLSTPPGGLPGGAISGDGRYVVFTSLASNLVPGDTNNDWDVFLKDTTTGDIKRVSVSTGGGQVGPPGVIERWRTAYVLNGEPDISDDGRYVVFSSYSTQLVGNDSNGVMDVFRHDTATGVTELVSISTTGAQGNGDSDMPSISRDGRCVAFRSLAGNINEDPTAPDTNFQYDIYVRDMVSGHTKRVSIGFDGSEPDDISYYPRISADCTHIVWVSWATNIVPGDTNETLDVFMRPVEGGPITRVNTTASNEQANLRTGGPAVPNQNGRYVAFYSWATNLVPEDNNNFCNYTAIVNSTNCIDIFVKDVWTSAITRVSLTAGGQETFNNNQDPSISGNGTSLAFGSYAANLDPDKTTGFQDIFFVYTGLAPSP